MNATYEKIAEQLRDAASSGIPIDPIRDQLGETDIDAAYAVQKLNTDHYVHLGRKVCGRKIGLTSPAVQKQLGVDQPDYGMLYSDMQFCTGDTIPSSRLMQPKIEAELAIVLNNDLPDSEISESQLVASIDYVLPAIEVVGSRIANWQINICDTIADNASSGVYVVGNTPVRFSEVDMRLCGMVLERESADGMSAEPVSTGCGAACLGSPVIAATWLANKMAEHQTPLAAGDIILTGAMGPMVNVQPGERYTARINGVGNVTVKFASGPFGKGDAQ